MNKFKDIALSCIGSNPYKIEGNILKTRCDSCNFIVIPFEKKPTLSLNISLDTGNCRCTECGISGNIIDLIRGRMNKTEEEAKAILDNYLPLENYANKNNYPIEFLESFGLKNNDCKIEMPYFDINKSNFAVRYWANDNTFTWEKKSKSNFYGIWKIKEFNDNSYIVLVKSEWQALALWYNNIQAIAVPESIKFREDYELSIFDKFEKIYIVCDNTLESTAFARESTELLPCDKLYKIFPSKIDTACITPLDLHINSKLSYTSLMAVAEKISPSPAKITTNKERHVEIGEVLISKLNLKYYNGQLYTYQNGVYRIATDSMLKSYILHEIDINAKRSQCTESIEFIKNWLANDTTIEVDANYVNFLNGLIDIRTGILVPHTSDIFTVNQVQFNYLTKLQPNELVDNYLNQLMCDKPYRVEALLQLIGYSCTASTEMQQSMIWYGKRL